jgi:hypothetical protein
MILLSSSHFTQCRYISLTVEYGEEAKIENRKLSEVV